MALIRGTNSADILDGTIDADEIIGRKGDDLLNGFEGNDTLKGGSGDDTVLGGLGDDLLLGGSGTDSLDGGAGSDMLKGGSGNDRLFGGAGDDTINGNRDIDTAVFSGNRDDYVITQLDGNSLRIEGPDGNDVVHNVEFFEFADMTQSFAEVVLPRTVNLTAGTLTVDDVTLDPEQVMQVSLDITSTGTIAAGATTMRFVVMPVDDPDAKYFFAVNKTVEALGSGETVTISSGLASWGLQGGTYYVGAIVDPLGNLDESIETDNVANWVEITIADWEMDQSIASFSANGGAPVLDLANGDTLTYDLTIAATGNVRDQSFMVTFYASTDGVLSNDDVQLGEAYDVVAMGGAVDLTGAVSASGLVAGDYELFAVLTPTGWSAGLDDPGNNVVQTSLSVVGEPVGPGGDDDLVVGTAGNDFFETGVGDDTMIGSEGEDYFNGGEGVDTADFSSLTYGMFFGDASDYAGPGIVEVTPAYGGYSYDRTYLENVEAIIGTDFDDQVYIVGGSVRSIETGGGNDQIVGSFGDDTIDAGAGNDEIAGLSGDDFIFTGSGADVVFVDRVGTGGAATGDGHDVIVDFDVSMDILAIEYDYGVPAYDPFADFTQTAEGALLQYADGSSVLLLDVDLMDLNPGNVISYEEYVAQY